MAKASWDMIPFARWIGGAAVLAAMLLGLGSAADAKDCTRATPLPIDTTITAPADDVPADLAQFSGTWGGVWTTGPGDVGPCGTLVVEEIFPNGFVRVISSTAMIQISNIHLMLNRLSPCGHPAFHYRKDAA